MKKNKMMRLASVMLVLTMLSTSVISGTFAKYTTKYTATDTAKVATFDVTVMGVKADAATETVTVDIFKDSAVYDTEGLTDFPATGTNDTNIKDGSGTPIIAPGSWGVFTFDVVNNSEVTVQYSIDYTIDEAGVPLQWSLTGADGSWSDDLADVAVSADTTLTYADGTPVTKTVTIYWQWDFEGDDNALGFAAVSATPTVQIDVTVEQVD